MSPQTQERLRRLLDVGFERFAVGEYSLAEECFRNVLIATPEDEDAWIGLGSCLLRQERYAEAAMVLGLAAVAVGPDSCWPSLLAADALVHDGRSNEALDALQWFEEMAERGLATDSQKAHAGQLRERALGRETHEHHR